VSKDSCRVARVFFEHDTKTGKNVPNQHKMVIEYPKYLWNVPNGHKIYQHFPILPKIIKIG
jgi:hypothetical protein